MHCSILETYLGDTFFFYPNEKNKQTNKSQGAIQTGHHQVKRTVISCYPTGADTKSNRKGIILWRAQNMLEKACRPQLSMTEQASAPSFFFFLFSSFLFSAYKICFIFIHILYVE